MELLLFFFLFRTRIVLMIQIRLHKESFSSLFIQLFSCSVVSDSLSPWTVACQAPLSMEFSRQEYWSGLPRPPPGDLPDPGMEPTSLMSPVLAGRFFTTGITRRRGLHINKATVIHTTKHSHAYDFNI